MNSIQCPICKEGLKVSLAKGRKSGKPFIMLVCPKSGKHFRGFISDQEYVGKVLEGTEETLVGRGGGGVGSTPGEG